MSERSLPGSRLESLLGQIADEFTDHLNRGEQPDVDEYLARYPELSSVLRQLLPALVVINDSCGESLDDPLPFEPSERESRRLGDFRILREIARGGMGIVYEAEQISLARRVALKVLPFAGALDPRSQARFRNESLAAAQLHHSNIVPVYAVGNDRGVHFYAMQFIEGGPLSDVLTALRAQSSNGAAAIHVAAPEQSSANATVKDRRGPEFHGAQTASGLSHRHRSRSDAGPLSTSVTALLTQHASHREGFHRAIARLGIQAAEALEYAHQRGIVHRDIKPSNLLLDVRGDLWVTDFGLARIEHETQLTVTGEMFGTFRYMSPECVSGDFGRGFADHRCDIYSLGVSLYELLTRMAPFTSETRPELFRKICEDDPQPLRRLDHCIPVELESIILKAMEKSPADRYGTAQELADDLRRFLEHRPIVARRPTPWDRLRKWSRRHQQLVLFASISISLLVVGMSAAGWWISLEQARANVARAEAAEQFVVSERQRLIADEQKRLAESRLSVIRSSEYVTNINLAAAAFQYGDFDKARESLAVCVPQPGEKDLRGFEWRLLSHWLRDRSVLNRHEGAAYFANFSPDGKQLATAGQDGVRVWKWTPNNSMSRLDQIAHLTAHQSEVNGVAWSPDGHLLATAGDDGTVRIWETANWQPLRILQHSAAALAPVFTPDGKQLMTADRTIGAEQSRPRRESNVLRFWDTTSWQESPEVKMPSGVEIHDMKVSPDGTRMAIAGAHFVQVWDLTTRSEIYRLPHPSTVICVAFTIDSSVVCTGGVDQMVRLWNLKDGSLIQAAAGHLGHIESIHSAPDGKSIVTTDSFGALRIWAFRETDGKIDSQHVFRASRRLWCSASAPDGDSLVATADDGAIIHWQRTKPQDHNRFLNALFGPGTEFAFSPDGLWIAMTGIRVRIIDRNRLPDAEQNAQLLDPHHDSSPTTSFVSLLFTPTTGKLVACDSSMRGTTWQSQDWARESAKLGDVESRCYLTANPRTGEILLKIKDRYEWNGPGISELFPWQAKPIDWLSGARYLTFRPDGSRVAVLTPNRAFVHDWPSGEVVRSVTWEKLENFTWSNHNRWIAGALNDGTIELRSPETLGKNLSWVGDVIAVAHVAFSSDDLTLAGSLHDGRVRLWNVATGRELLTLEAHPLANGRQLKFSPEGELLGSIGVAPPADNELLLWRAPMDTLD